MVAIDTIAEDDNLIVQFVKSQVLQKEQKMNYSTAVQMDYVAGFILHSSI